MFSAARILAIRKSKGFLQEVLAEQSGEAVPLHSLSAAWGPTCWVAAG